jgi:hypothetical protein
VGQATYFVAIRQLAGGRLSTIYRERVHRRFRRCLAQARSRNAALILSAEFAYGWSREQHLNWRQFAQEHGLDLRIVVYLRSPIDWLASALSQGLKYGRHTTHDGLIDTFLRRIPERQLDYAARIDMLAEVYGPEALVIRPFLRNQLQEGCVVRDFCRVVGLQQAPATIHRQNDSLSLEACQCLHLRNLALGRPLRGPLDLLRRDVLLLHLGRIFQGRPSLRLQPAVLGERLEEMRQRLNALEQRHGIALPLTTGAAGDGLASLDPLLNLPAAALEQLVVASGGRDTSEQALARLERGLAVAPTVHVARRYLRRKMRHIRSGC